MEVVSIVGLLALVQYLYFLIQAGRARVEYEVEAPAVSGHALFERRLRVQQNTLEQLIIFLPALWCFARYVNPAAAAVLGLFFILGRGLYSAGYVSEPKKRTMGMTITFIVEIILLGGSLIWAMLAWWF